MKRIHLLPFILIGMLMSSGPAWAQLELGGYYEHTFQADYSEQTNEVLLDASKIRLDLFAGGGEQELEFRGNVNFVQYHGEVEYDVSPYLPDDIAAGLQAFGLNTITLDRSRIYLDNAFLVWSSGPLRLRAGKQQLSWGPAYSINPTDLFHRKTLIDPTYEKEGVTALRADFRWGIGGQLALIMAPDQKLDESGYALRAATYVPALGYDMALTLHSVTDSTSFNPNTFRPVQQRRHAVGLDLSGSLLGLGAWVEGNYNWMEEEEDFLRVVGGLDYTLSSGLYMMLEVLYNGRAADEKPYPLHDWLANLVYGEPVGPGWVMAGVRKDLTSLITGEFYVFASPDRLDREDPAFTAMLNPRLTASIAQNADATLFGGITLGEDDGALPGGLYSLVVRGTVYF